MIYSVLVRYVHVVHGVHTLHHRCRTTILSVPVGLLGEATRYLVVMQKFRFQAMFSPKLLVPPNVFPQDGQTKAKFKALFWLAIGRL